MFRNILLAIDLEAPGSWQVALGKCRALVHAFDGRLTLCTIVSDRTAAHDARWSPIGYRELIEEARVRLLDIAPDDPPVEVEVNAGSVDAGVLGIATRIGADLIVLSSHKPAFKDHLLGSNARRIAGGAPQSVLVVRGVAEPTPD